VNYAAVGAFVLVLGAMLVTGLLWLLSGGVSRQSYDLYLAIETESVAGLNLAAPVKYNGVAVGKVQDIRLDPSNPDLVRLVFAIQHGVPIHADTVAVLNTQGLTGIAYVELSGGTRDAPPLLARPGEAYPQIRTRPSLGARLANLEPVPDGTISLSIPEGFLNSLGGIETSLERRHRVGAGAELISEAGVLNGLGHFVGRFGQRFRVDRLAHAARSFCRAFA